MVRTMMTPDQVVRKLRRQWCGVAVLLLAAALLFPAPVDAASKRLRVTTTVSMLTDLVRDIGGERVAVEGLMGPGVDPHLYKATASDVTRLSRADAVFYVGLHLEGKMQEVFAKLQQPGREVAAVTDVLPRSVCYNRRSSRGTMIRMCGLM